ncbi:glycosyltransferase family 2 protein [Massilia glaciei]|uniref:Glycosyltransferase family 2 protein n=1 Tax=Massilia glaciei TaxID=1524097 RepID=A0A2U2HC18_9BURK|nr:glycosyltransferase family 2 protein [Massilia glaciei]PWF40437.1 glycosyltransferase family 2 protein [Massilia glaciei]
MNDQAKRAPALISVMMPCLNGAAFLDATIESIRAQTYPHWELLFVDDGSTDRTLEIIERHARADARIRVFAMPHGGRGRARNTCIGQVRGEFVAVCDADDISFPERFATQVAYLQDHPGVGVLGSGWVPFVHDPAAAGRPATGFPATPQAIGAQFSRGKMRFHNATAMLRAALFERFGAYNAELRRAQDYEFYSRLSRAGVQFAALPEALLYYRQEGKIPSLMYFRENGMFMSYADRVLNGKNGVFADFASSLGGRAWYCYYTLKYAYFYLKMRVRNHG